MVTSCVENKGCCPAGVAGYIGEVKVCHDTDDILTKPNLTCRSESKHCNCDSQGSSLRKHADLNLVA